MLAPPNRGSRVASIIALALGWFFKPLTQLADRDVSFVNRLAVPDGLDIGIIAAARDRVVALESTYLPTQCDDIVVPAGHTTMLFRRDVAAQVGHFLEHRRFACEQELQRASQT